jgi:hypothetical protein
MHNFKWQSSSDKTADWGDDYYSDDVKAAVYNTPDYDALTDYWATGLEERKKRDKHIDERAERRLARKLHRGEKCRS